ncbi:hypothetical protein D9Q98_000037 [Chlorella vulgaris]|uniref:Uncharacterized protein n=1 Tax=Chlorella vulgaris TaxID=3077 RepID=A0A9D4TXB5_CHLVU|nr:hypothetical protein D9Q98_000037 [Chlorella vulgaris]
MQCLALSPRSGLLRRALPALLPSPGHCSRRTYPHHRTPLPISAAAGGKDQLQQVPPHSPSVLTAEDFSRWAAIGKCALICTLYAIRFYLKFIPGGDAYEFLFAGFGFLLIPVTPYDTGAQWLALDAKLAKNRQVLQLKREQALTRRAKKQRGRGAAVRKDLYRAGDVEEYLEYGTLLPLVREILQNFRVMLKSGAAQAEVFLLVAARAGDAETVEELLAAGADPLCTDQQGRTALQLAVGGAARKMLAAAARAAPKAES